MIDMMIKVRAKLHRLINGKKKKSSKKNTRLLLKPVIKR